MTSKDFDLLADAIGRGMADSRHLVNASAVGDIIRANVAIVLAESNRRFDSKRFEIAVGAAFYRYLGE